MIKNSLIFFLLIYCVSLYPQEWNRARLDSLFSEYVNLHHYSLPELPQNPAEDTIHTKCGFGTAAEVFIHFNEFTETQQRILKVLVIARPTGPDASIVSPAGFFRVHYYSSGPFVPQYDLNEFASALDSSYNFEVNHLGYPPPPPDTQPGLPPDSVGGDSKYDVYIIPMGDYGETDFETQISQDPGILRFTTFMKVHYSFGSGFYTHGIDAARVTAAHEFHHSIQVGNYIFRDNDLFFYELTSTSMEEFVYDSVNDYYGYMSDYFNNTDRAFASNSGYNLAIWNIFLADKFGIDLIKKQWEKMPSSRAINAINSSLYDEGSSFGKELNKFGIWTFFTNYRAVPGQYFEEAAAYPLLHMYSVIPFIPPVVNTTMIAHPTSNNFIYIVDQQEADTLTVLITNADYQKGIDSVDSFFPFQYLVYNYNEPGSQQLTGLYYSKLITDQPSQWTSSEFFNRFLIHEGEIPVEAVNYAFPNPFVYSKHSYIYFPVKGSGSQEANLNVYTSSMDLVYSVTKPYDFISGQKVLKWNGLDNKNRKVSSGIYIFITESGNAKKVGKLVIFNE
ncbi:MAG TPA: hypothetical protein VKD08_17590 [Ignavibacteriaceae bacterium]|nr:hypothetical protein [Ignavibacteriaceae bacterium]